MPQPTLMTAEEFVRRVMTAYTPARGVDRNERAGMLMEMLDRRSDALIARAWATLARSYTRGSWPSLGDVAQAIETAEEQMKAMAPAPAPQREEPSFQQPKEWLPGYEQMAASIAGTETATRLAASGVHFAAMRHIRRYGVVPCDATCANLVRNTRGLMADLIDALSPRDGSNPAFVDVPRKVAKLHLKHWRRDRDLCAEQGQRYPLIDLLQQLETLLGEQHG